MMPVPYSYPFFSVVVIAIVIEIVIAVVGMIIVQTVHGSLHYIMAKIRCFPLLISPMCPTNTLTLSM